ncbi:unnamed protein product [Spodoptera littoralis]|uniref:Gustatory receptor n=1 Tax=Spodoptera littoralis TaxID=7109 RepID=A0A9P0I5S4_SPOLI|nr:unnamed protein product [Spodoptera littoralis]CAH1640536.1 unnamed protein product [Spodoptera littoralis]
MFYAILTTCRYVIALVIRIELWKISFENRTTTEYFIFSFISLTWIFKNLTLFILLSVECEKFYSTMEEIQSTCKQFINWNQHSGNQKRVCKNIQRLHKTNFKKTCVCGVFFIDAAMSIQLSSIISTFTIVILQFEFL